MTNAEKYQEVFGFPPDTGICPAKECKVCPCRSNQPYRCKNSFGWWNEEYKENKE